MVIASFMIFDQLKAAGSGMVTLRLTEMAIDRANDLDDVPVMDEGAQTIVPADFAKTWIEGILDLCSISYEYYDKHRKDVVSINASKNNREFNR